MSALAVAALLLSTPSLAGEDSGLRLGLGLGWFQPGKNETVIDGSWTVVPRLGYDFNQTFGLEADLGWSQGLTRTVGRQYNVLTPRLNLLVHAPPVGPVTFFGAVGPGLYWKKVKRTEGSDIGTGTYDDSNDDLGFGQYKNPDTDFLLNVGPGALLRFGEGPVGLRTDFRYMLSAGSTPADKDDDPTTLESDRYDNWEWTVGLTFLLGRGAKDTDGDGYKDDVDSCVEEAEDFDKYKDEDGCPDTDNDKDGIKDAKDTCPDEPEDRDDFQDEDGCPDPDNDGDGVLDGDDRCPLEPGQPASLGCPDSDLDGVIDREDECPQERGPKETMGCPDRDEDRVPDKRDECPDEPADPRIDPNRSNGCPTRVLVTKEQIVILDKVFFDTNKATIKKGSYEILNQVAEVLLKYPDIRKVEVAGHTDSDGSDAANLDLSQRRVESVRQYLVSKGVAEDRLVAKGYGESKPIGDNSTAAGKAENRRVEFNILEQ
ncbi:OmpA family protein [Myxococcota bacterium]|nr:OmpA family protein [Myxococcota bacterium]